MQGFRGYILKRFLQAPLVLFILISCSFFLIRFAPGGPFDGTSDRAMDPEVVASLEAKYGFDKPLVYQYYRYMGNILQGDLGLSTKQRNRTINDIIGTTLPKSLRLGALAFCLALSIGVTSGLFAALNHHTWRDWVTMSFAVLGIALPVFVFGPLMQWVIAGRWQILPFAGFGEGALEYLFLPALTLALPFAARFSRLTRTGMLEVLHEDFIRTARAKGLPGWMIILKHALRGGLIPAATYAGPAAAAMLTGSLVIEKIFLIPGLGSEFVNAALNRDHFLVMGTVIVYGTFLIFFNLLSDLLVAWLDPRIKLHQ